MSTSITANNIIGKGVDQYQGHSPSWVLTFATFKNPSPEDPTTTAQANAQSSGNGFKVWNTAAKVGETNDPIVVTSDCISLQTSHSKANFLHSMEATLMGGNINYLAAINPGDYVTVNILDNPQDAIALAQKAALGSAVNSVYDGFKGIYKVTSVRKKLIAQGNGMKRVVFTVQGQAFSELNNSIYFNPYIVSSFGQAFLQYYLTNISYKFQNRVGSPATLQEIVSILLEMVLGSGPVLKNGNIDTTTKPPLVQPSVAQEKKVNTVNVSPNRQFLISGAIANLLGISGAQSFNELYRFMFGVQKYDANGYQPILKTKTNPNNYYETPNQVTGSTIIRPEYFNMSTGWSIIQSYCNAPINEMYTTFRLSPEGVVMPFLVFRQIPFSTGAFSKEANHLPATSFTSLPRWIVSPDSVLEENIGRDDAARFNFVQVFGQPFGWSSAGSDRNIATQISQGKNVMGRTQDITRSGLRPYVIQNSMDLANVSQSGGSSFLSNFWTQLLGDAVMGGQMKLNGTIRCFGIAEPVSVGDNLEFDGVVYHIEGIRHQCSVSEYGIAQFFTSFDLSHGVDKTSQNADNTYGDTTSKTYEDAAKEDWKNNKIIPSTVNDSTQDGIVDNNLIDLPASIDNTIRNFDGGSA